MCNSVRGKGGRRGAGGEGGDECTSAIDLSRQCLRTLLMKQVLLCATEYCVCMRVCEDD